ncbi:MAG: RagB/SusD family nutrient uptake outer membrane protein [Chitinophagaceae bacterium]|nr:RagB/SusD family nutrient uptake outer membrane protein [Chitinophagaceae bacterium]
MKTLYIILIAWAVTLTSCTKFLDEAPTGALTPETEVTSPEIARAFANASYAELTVLDRGAGGYGGNTAELMEFMTGKADGNPQTEGFRFYNLTYDAQSFYIDDWWQSLYRGIANCNLSLQKISEIEFDEATKSNMLAEVHTLRALYYFYLVRMYGDVPKITEVVDDLSQARPNRAPAKDIYDSIIIPDLLLAEQSSLPWSDQTGLVSMSAVKSLLADVYLTYAGYPVQGGDQYYAESAARSKEVIDNGGYTLFDEYSEMTLPANKNKGEFIWQVQFAADITPNDLTAKTLALYKRVSVYSDEFGGLVPTRQFVESYPDGDKRVEERQFFYTWYPGNPGAYPAGDPRRDSVNLGGYYLYKWFDRQAVTNTARSDLNYTIYRLADVMLMYAEASNRANGGPDNFAEDYVNAIRERAGLGPVTDLGMTAFEEEVWNQRYLELCYEGKTWFDMLRTRKVRNDITGEFDDFVGHTTVWGKTLTENQLLFPIPLREINNNPNLTQNGTF